jgi:hypothetical protein
MTAGFVKSLPERHRDLFQVRIQTLVVGCGQYRE